jgi:hypothetical protein
MEQLLEDAITIYEAQWVTGVEGCWIWSGLGLAGSRHFTGYPKWLMRAKRRLHVVETNRREVTDLTVCTRFERIEEVGEVV